MYDQATTPSAAKPKPRRRWYQYGLRTLLIVVTVLSLPCCWFGWRVRDARKQQAAVTAIRKSGGAVVFDYQFDSRGFYAPDAPPPGPAWLRAVLGDDFFTDVFSVDLSDTAVTDAELQHLEGLTNLTSLYLSHTRVGDAGLEHLRDLKQLSVLRLIGTQVSDAGLRHLRGLTHLVELDLSFTHVTDEGARALENGLPGCVVFYQD